MDREIKFRAWDKLRNEMQFFDDLYWFEENFVSYVPDSRYILMQFTGMRDKNGAEIYEGDILKVIGWRGSNGRVEVKWGRVDASDDAGSNMVGFPCFDEYGEPEIIGNIFENPELPC